MIDKKTRYFIFGSSEPRWRKRYYFKKSQKDVLTNDDISFEEKLRGAMGRGSSGS